LYTFGVLFSFFCSAAIEPRASHLLYKSSIMKLYSWRLYAS
jgi:hypothetical protein